MTWHSDRQAWNENGQCAREACRQSLRRERAGGVWYNTGSDLLYCVVCARLINGHNSDLVVWRPDHEPIELERIPHIGTHEGHAFVDWRDDSAPHGMSGDFRKVTCHEYPPQEFELRALRRSVGMTLGEAARLLGIGVASMSDLERGRARPVRGWLEIKKRLVRVIVG